MNVEFFKDQIRETTEYLTRDEDPPQLGAHVMGEYLFCGRSGQLTVESQGEDSGIELIPAPALAGVAAYEIDKIEADNERFARSLLQVAALFAATVILTGVVALFNRLFALALLIGTAIGIALSGRLFWWAEVRRYLFSKARLKAATRAAKREPNWDLATQQEVGYWELINAGFDSRELRRALYNPDINLRGKPWRILRRGDKHLPVLRIRVTDFDPRYVTQIRLHEQQRARLAAYAFLIETCERGQADWAIVLINDTDFGIAVPIGERDWWAFREGLLHARIEIRKLKEDPRYRAPAPTGRQQCRRCPFGQPRQLGKEPTVLAGVRLPAFTTREREGVRLFHCTCGDRFQDVPPHEDASRLGLLDKS